jgi:hypothetical protein
MPTLCGSAPGLPIARGLLSLGDFRLLSSLRKSRSFDKRRSSFVLKQAMVEMTDLKSQCPFCTQWMLIPAELVGSEVICPNCDNQFFAPKLVDDDDAIIVDDVIAHDADPPAVSHLSAATNFTSGSSTAPQPPGPDFVRCHFCHQYIPKDQFFEHRAQHNGSAADGQQVSTMTLPPEQRYQGSMDGVPDTYFHSVCGQRTTMSKDIIRTYLADPYFYAYRSFCCGCQRSVSQKELVWIDTHEPLTEYFDRIKRIIPDAQAKRQKAITSLLTTSLIGAAALALLGGIFGICIGSSTGALAFGLGGAIAGYGASIGILYMLKGGL